MNTNLHCEITGKSASLDDTVTLTKINAVVVLKNFDNPKIDRTEKKIFSSTKPPLRFYSEIPVPHDLLGAMGPLFSIVNDEDDLEQSTAIMSKEGIRLYTGRQLLPFIDYVDYHELVQIPETMFIAVVDKDNQLMSKNCGNWNIPFGASGRKYMFKKIIDEKKEKQTFGYPGILLPGYDVAISDCSEKNPNGSGYLFKTESSFHGIDLCSNESAVDFCVKNRCLVYYNDFLNKGNLRLLSGYTEDINNKLQNPYKFRSSNI